MHSGWTRLADLPYKSSQNNSDMHTVPTLHRRQFIKILPFLGSGQLKFWPKKGAKKPQKVDFCEKKFIQFLTRWWFNQEWQSICVDTVGNQAILTGFVWKIGIHHCVMFRCVGNNNDGLRNISRHKRWRHIGQGQFCLLTLLTKQVLGK